MLMRKLIVSFMAVGLFVVFAPQTQAAVTWKTYIDSAITYQYPAWVVTEPTRIWQSATAASPTLAVVNDDASCSFTMAYEPKGVTGIFTSVIPSRLTTRATEKSGTIVYSNVKTATFESQVVYPYNDGTTDSTLIQYTYGYRSANGSAYYLAYTSAFDTFEGSCKPLMFTTMASVKNTASASEKVDAKSAAIVKNVKLGTIKSSARRTPTATTTFSNGKLFCYYLKNHQRLSGVCV